MSKMLEMISDTERLANDLSSVDLISYPVKDDVITTNLSRYQKASKLLNEIERSLRVSTKPETLISYCEALKKQQNSALTRIAQDMLLELGELHVSIPGMIITVGHRPFSNHLHHWPNENAFSLTNVRTVLQNKQ